MSSGERSVPLGALVILPDQMIGGILFLSCLSVCLFVCLSVVNFNLRYNFWTVRDRDFIFGMHISLMTPFQLTPRSMNCDLDFDLESKIALWTLFLDVQEWFHLYIAQRNLNKYIHSKKESHLYCIEQISRHLWTFYFWCSLHVCVLFTSFYRPSVEIPMALKLFTFTFIAICYFWSYGNVQESTNFEFGK